MRLSRSIGLKPKPKKPRTAPKPEFFDQPDLPDPDIHLQSGVGYLSMASGQVFGTATPDLRAVNKITSVKSNKGLWSTNRLSWVPNRAIASATIQTSLS